MGVSTDAVKQSRFTMVVIAMGKPRMSLNLNALPVSIGSIVEEFNR